MKTVKASTTISVSDSDSTKNESLKIEGYPMAGHAGINPYCNVIIFPASADLIVKATVGTITRKETVSKPIYHEIVNVNGKVNSTSFYINSLAGPVEGTFFDNTTFAEVSPSFSVKDGQLICSLDCSGTAILSYNSYGVVYEYNANLEHNAQMVLTKVSIGAILAFIKKRKGIAARYEVPPHNADSRSKEKMAVIVRQVVVVGKDTFEMPDGTPAWPDDAIYTQYQNLQENQKPEVGSSYSVQEWEHETLFIEADSVWSEKAVTRWFNPVQPADVGGFKGVKYKLNSSIPTTPDENYTQDIIDSLNAELLLMKARYPGVT